jgi:hypothetical protein
MFRRSNNKIRPSVNLFRQFKASDVLRPMAAFAKSWRRE